MHPPLGSSFTFLNLPPTFELPEYMEYLALQAGPNTDLWREPRNVDINTAPIVFTSRLQFDIAEVTVSADWELEGDQGGLVIFTGAAPQSLSEFDTRTLSPCKWVKAGMEFSSGTMNASSVSATTDGADWCGWPLESTGLARRSLRIKLERVGDALWIWYQDPSACPYALSPGAVQSTWTKMRVMTSFFYGVNNKFVHVGVYASRPGRPGDSNSHMIPDPSLPSNSDALNVTFDDLEIL